MTASMSKANGALLFMIPADLGEGQARCIVDGHVDELVASAAAFALLMRWPGLTNLPSFLMSIWMSSPGCSRSYRRTGSAGSRSRIPLNPKRRRIRLTVAGDTSTSVAICLPVWRCRRNVSTAAHVAGGVWLGDE